MGGDLSSGRLTAEDRAEVDRVLGAFYGSRSGDEPVLEFPCGDTITAAGAAQAFATGQPDRDGHDITAHFHELIGRYMAGGHASLEAVLADFTGPAQAGGPATEE